MPLWHYHRSGLLYILPVPAWQACTLAGAEPVAAAPPVGAGLFWPESALFRPGTGAAAGLLRPEWVSCGRSSGSSGRGAALTPAGEETRSGLLLQPEQWSEQMAGRVWKNVPVFLVVTASLPP